MGGISSDTIESNALKIAEFLPPKFKIFSQGARSHRLIWVHAQSSFRSRKKNWFTKKSFLDNREFLITLEYILNSLNAFECLSADGYR